MGLAEYLEAVADADDGLSLFSVASHGAHHRREAGDSARPQGVAVGEAGGEHDAVVRGEVALAEPDEIRLVAHDVSEGVLAVAVAPGAGEDDDGEAHGPTMEHRTRNKEQGPRRSSHRGCSPSLLRRRTLVIMTSRTAVAAEIDAIYHPRPIARVHASANP